MSTRAERELGELPSGEVNGRRLAELLGVAHGTVKRWRHEGMPGRRDGHHLWINVAEARAWLAERFGDAGTVAFNRRSQVYVAVRERDAAVKVGWSSDVTRRVSELRKTVRCPVELVACLPGDKPMELRVHERLRPYCIGGEWYEVDADVAVAALRESA